LLEVIYLGKAFKIIYLFRKLREWESKNIHIQIFFAGRLTHSLSILTLFFIFSIHVIRFACLLLLLWCLTKIKSRLASFSVLNSHLMTSEIIRISNRSVSAVAFSNYIILVTLKLNSISFRWSNIKIRNQNKNYTF